MHGAGLIAVLPFTLLAFAVPLSTVLASAVLLFTVRTTFHGTGFCSAAFHSATLYYTSMLWLSWWRLLSSVR